MLQIASKNLSHKILIVEDDPIIALDLSLVVGEMGCTVVGIANNYQNAIKLMQSDPADILLCDINLQSIQNGIDVAESICHSHNPAVIFLTGLDDNKTLHSAVNTNPCGYLLKPYRYRELHALIEIAKRRTLENKPLLVALPFPLGGGYHFDLENGILTKEDQPNIVLTVNEYKLISFLMENRHKIVPFEVIEHHIWATKPTAESARRTLFYRLHAKLDTPIITVLYSRGCYLTQYPPSRI